MDKLSIVSQASNPSHSQCPRLEDLSSWLSGDTCKTLHQKLINNLKSIARGTGSHLIIKRLVHQKAKSDCSGNGSNHCKPFPGPCIVKSIRILNINPKGMVNKRRKDCVTFLSIHKLFPQHMHSPTHTHKAPKKDHFSNSEDSVTSVALWLTSFR